MIMIFKLMLSLSFIAWWNTVLDVPILANCWNEHRLLQLTVASPVVLPSRILHEMMIVNGLVRMITQVESQWHAHHKPSIIDQVSSLHGTIRLTFHSNRKLPFGLSITWLGRSRKGLAKREKTRYMSHVWNRTTPSASPWHGRSQTSDSTVVSS